MKILACVDGSEHSFNAIEEAAKIAAGMDGADVTIINVDEVMPDKPYFSEDSLKEMEARNRADREKIMARAVKIFEERNLKVNTLIKKGEPASTIIELAEEENFDVVVLGSRGHGGLKQALLGSVSNAVAQSVKAHVFIVK